MSRPAAEREEVAALAAKIAALPSHAASPSGKAGGSLLPDANSPSRFRSWLYWLAYGLAWLVTTSLVAVGLFRIFYHDGAHFLTWINAFTRYVYLPAYACMAWAIWKRRWALAAVNLAIVGLHLALIAPDFLRDRRFDSVGGAATVSSPDSPVVRIFFANVRGLNTEHQAMLDEIKAADPDVIILVEFSWLWSAAYRNSPVFKQYPYGGGMENKRLGTVNVFSKIPLTSERSDWFAGRGLETFQISVGSKSLHIIGLHAPRPMDIRNDDYEGFWSRTTPLILAEKGPLVVVGDFNATQFSAVYKNLTADHLRSAHQDRGRGYALSWPNGQYSLPSLIRIDQALLSPEVECLDIREGEGRGSDHKPLILDVRIRDNR